MLEDWLKSIIYIFFYTINKPSGRNTSQGTYIIWQERTKCTDTHVDPNKLANVRRYILKNNRLRDAGKNIIKKQVATDIKWNEIKI